MPRQNKSNTERKRSPPLGRTQTQAFQMRVSDAFLRLIDEWRRKQPDLPTRAEAMRRLVEQALASAGPRQRSPESRRKAAELAAREIDQLGQTSGTPEEHARRKRRLIKGPREFREVRGDQRKTK